MWEWFTNFLYLILDSIHNLVGDWGLAVIILTVIIRLILTPLMTHSTKTTARMQVMQPKLKEIQDKYADDPTRQSEELRKVYADMHFNPLGGCWPLLLQLPIFTGLFQVAKKVPTDANFFSILPSISTSCSAMVSQGDWVGAAPYIVFVLLFGILTFIPMMMNSSSSMDPAQQSQTKVMGVVMSLMMLWFGYTVPGAVLLYYVTSSAWQVIQQKVITSRVMEKARAEAEAQAASRPVEVDVVRREKKPRPHKKK